MIYVGMTSRDAPDAPTRRLKEHKELFKDVFGMAVVGHISQA